MEPNKFDDFIKSNTENDLPVPTELNWENMNFNLPPANRKRRILFWMLFFLAGTLVIGSGLWYASKRGNTQSQQMAKKVPVAIQNQNSKINLYKEESAADMLHTTDAGVNDVTQQNSNKQQIVNPEPVVVQQYDAGENREKSDNNINQENLKTQPPASASIARSRDAGENPESQHSGATPGKIKTKRIAGAEITDHREAGINIDNSENGTIQETLPTAPIAGAEMINSGNTRKNAFKNNNGRKQQKIKTEQRATIAIKEGKSLDLTKTSKPNDIAETNSAAIPQAELLQPNSTEKTKQSAQKLPELLASTNVAPVDSIGSISPEKKLSVSPESRADSNTKQLRKSTTILLSIGTNKAQMNHNSARLNNAVTAAWGNSFQLLLEQELKNNWLLSMGLGYQRLHTTFYFEKDLGTFVDATRLQVIRKTQHVFHNNYVDLVSLNIGAGKQFKISPRWHSQFLLYLSPTHRVSYEGKSLDDSASVVVFDPNTAAQKKWLLNADAAFRLTYNLEKTTLLLGVNVSQSLTKTNLYTSGNNTTTMQPRVFGVNLGIKKTIGRRKK